MHPSIQRSKDKGKDCKTCKQIRYFLVIAAAILMLMWSQPDWRLPPGFDYATLVGDLFLWAFLLVFAYKAWRYFFDKNK
jgi:hypothetical protein